jgi:hypothetical protein
MAQNGAAQRADTVEQGQAPMPPVSVPRPPNTPSTVPQRADGSTPAGADGAPPHEVG